MEEFIDTDERVSLLKQLSVFEPIFDQAEAERDHGSRVMNDVGNEITKIMCRLYELKTGMRIQ